MKKLMAFLMFLSATTMGGCGAGSVGADTAHNAFLFGHSDDEGDGVF